MTPFEKLKAERDAVRQFKDAIKAKRQSLSDLETGLSAKMDEANAATIRVVALRDHKGGNPIEWPEDLRVREMPR